MSGLKGKFIRRDGTYAIFGSRNKPEWKGIEISGRCDPNLEPGQYYELEMEGRALVGWRKLEPMSGGGGGGSYSAPSQSYSAPAQSAAPGEVPLGSLMASATGFAKSAMESGVCKTWTEAAEAGIAWATRWGTVPAPKALRSSIPAPEDKAPTPPIEIDDEIPF